MSVDDGDDEPRLAELVGGPADGRRFPYPGDWVVTWRVPGAPTLARYEITLEVVDGVARYRYAGEDAMADD